MCARLKGHILEQRTSSVISFVSNINAGMTMVKIVARDRALADALISRLAVPYGRSETRIDVAAEFLALARDEGRQETAADLADYETLRRILAKLFLPN